MLRSGGLLSYADLARDAGMSPASARRYVAYLEASYQVLLLPLYSRNLTSTVVKAPKVYWMDVGLLRQGTHRWGPADGGLFETMVVGELRKWSSAAASSSRVAVNFCPSWRNAPSGPSRCTDCCDGTSAAVDGEEPRDASSEVWAPIVGYRNAMTCVRQLADDCWLTS